MEVLLLIYSVFLKITAALSVKHCYQCSDSNIETVGSRSLRLVVVVAAAAAALKWVISYH